MTLPDEIENIKQWPTIREVRGVSMKQIIKWMRCLGDPQTEEEIRVQEEVARAYIEINR